MKAETEALLQECRAALLRQSDERIAALLAQWFENLIGEEYLDEERDDLCLLLNYRVQSWSEPVSYATYTSWWEVEGYLEPSAGTFICADEASLRQRLLDLPIERFDLLVEMAYQARTALDELIGAPPLPAGWAGLREMATWLEQADPTASAVELKAAQPVYARFESKAQRRKRDEERAAQASEQGYLVLAPASSQVATDIFHNWCKTQKQPYILIEPNGRSLALIRIQLKTAGTRELYAIMQSFGECLPALVAPFIANAQAQGYTATLAWISNYQIVLENILAADAQATAREIVALWATITEEEKQRALEREIQRQADLVPIWKRELTAWREQGTQPELSPLAEEVVLPSEWEELLTREHLIAFLAYLGLRTTTRDAKASLVQRLQEHLATDPVARALFFEVFKRELAVPPWELETLLSCTPTERKRWTSEEKLPILDLRSFRKSGDNKTYPVFDRRIILTLSPSDLERWRAEHQLLVKEHRSAAARAAAARKKDSSGV